jgi:hypothetical protein
MRKKDETVRSPEIKSGVFLKDVDIIITLRSGGTDLDILQKLMKAISASSTSLVNTKVVTTEVEIKVNTSSSGKLSTLFTKLRIE